MRRSTKQLGFAMAVFGAWLAGGREASATMPIQKQSKEAGLPATTCVYCHVEKLPKKGAVTHNERGSWLVAEKDKRKAAAIDGAWLKDYKEPK